MNLMWFENFWIAGGVVLFFALGLPLFLFLVSTFSFAVPVSSISVSNSPFSGLIALFLSKGSNWDALRPPNNCRLNRDGNFFSLRKDASSLFSSSEISISFLYIVVSLLLLLLLSSLLFGRVYISSAGLRLVL